MLKKNSQICLLLTKNSQKNSPKNSHKNSHKNSQICLFLISQLWSKWNVCQAIKLNRKAKYSWLADNLGVSERTIQRAIDDLNKLRYIAPEHSKVKGEWQLLK